MAINFDSALGIHQYTVGVRAARSETLASNIANANTPNYKARDINFSQALAEAKLNQKRVGLARTSANHINNHSSLRAELGYRVPNQPETGDGNTVDIQKERNEFMQNSLEYNASIDFLNSKFKGLTKAIKGQ